MLCPDTLIGSGPQNISVWMETAKDGLWCMCLPEETRQKVYATSIKLTWLD